MQVSECHALGVELNCKCEEEANKEKKAIVGGAWADLWERRHTSVAQSEWHRNANHPEIFFPGYCRFYSTLKE